jgi:hypothetical protein
MEVSVIKVVEKDCIIFFLVKSFQVLNVICF